MRAILITCRWQCTIQVNASSPMPRKVCQSRSDRCSWVRCLAHVVDASVESSFQSLCPTFLLLTSSRIFRRGRRGVIAGISFGEINLASRRSAAGDTGSFQIDRPLQGAPGHVTPCMRCTGRNAANTTTYPNTRRQSRAWGGSDYAGKHRNAMRRAFFFLGYRCPGHRL